MELHPAILCFCSRSLTICTARWYSVCCFNGRATFALCLIFRLPECICSRDWRDCWFSAWSPSSFLIRAFPVLQFFFFFECSLMNMWSVYASFYPSDQLSLRNRSIVWWLGRRFCASSEMVAHQSPKYLIFGCAMALASLDLFGNSKLYGWLNELAAVLICNLCVLFLYGLSIRQASFHICRNLFTICFFWNNKYIERRLRCFCFLWWSLLC